uniref:Uncharacterized protein n=1 Tax=Pyrodinium bahamense TaxID=73915 RepID=A0A7S0B9I9_9DINO
MELQLPAAAAQVVPPMCTAACALRWWLFGHWEARQRQAANGHGSAHHEACDDETVPRVGDGSPVAAQLRHAPSLLRGASGGGVGTAATHCTVRSCTAVVLALGEAVCPSPRTSCQSFQGFFEVPSWDDAWTSSLALDKSQWSMDGTASSSREALDKMAWLPSEALPEWPSA